MNSNVLRILLLSCFVFLLTACVPSTSVEDVDTILIAGYDYIDDEQIRGTISIPQFGRLETGGSMKEKYLSSTANTVKEVHAKLQTKSSKPLTVGKLALSLYNEELAQNGLGEVLDNLGRDPQVGRDIILGVVEGSTEGFIKGKYSETETAAKYLTGLIRGNMEKNFPTTNLHQFLYAYHAKGMDGYLPLLAQEENYVRLTGIALFQDGKMVHSIPFSKSFIFKILKEKFQQGTQEVEFKNRHIVMENIGSSVKYHVKGKGSDSKVRIDIEITGIINEVSSLDVLQSPKMVELMEKRFEKFFQKQCEIMVQDFQEYNIDPLGLGNTYNSQVRGFDINKWKEIYPSLPIEINVGVEIVETGIVS
ncbi:Ger(x)C family spore germination protein [Pseudalkalibacillus decolorationis]|uniref:Ger(x)C family spore germination protein n=1 Tax=Pseudalkalibacillus decolorationis TaxID=163879 RepID=UPI002147AE0D|nr:Ger(x)C family spore germination protein [Pseudalkalibacillus decolorationis]